MNLAALPLLGFLFFFQTPLPTSPVEGALNLIPRDSTVVRTNTVFTISGVVTSSLLTNNHILECFVQDNEGGIELFNSDYRGPALSIGDSVTATGKLGLYFGQEELLSPTAKILRRGAHVTPIRVTLRELNSGDFHGRLVQSYGMVTRKISNGGGLAIYLANRANDTAAAFIDNRLIRHFDIDRIHRGEMISVTGIATRYSSVKPFTDNNEVMLRTSGDIAPAAIGSQGEFSGIIIIALIIILAVIGILVFFNYLLRSEVRQKTRQIEEHGKLSAVLYDAIAELSGLLDEKEIVTRVLKKLNPHVGMTSTLFCSSPDADNKWIISTFRLSGSDVLSSTMTFRSSLLTRVVGHPADEDALWGISIDDIFPPDIAPSDEDGKVSDHLRECFGGKRITVVKLGVSDANILVIFDHTMSFQEKLQREAILSFVRHLLAAIRGAELFALAQKQETAIEKLYNSSVFGLLTLSSDGTIRTANLVATEMLNDKDVVGKKIQRYLAPKDALRLEELLPSLATVPAEKFVRFEAKTQRGTAASTEVEFAVEFDTLSRTFNVSVQDIGDRRLFETFTAYEEKITALEKMASFLSHDLNNIVGSITGYASLLKKKLSSDSKEYHYAEVIENASQRTTELVKQVLGFAQMDAKTIEVVDLNIFVKNIASDFENVHEGKFDIVFDSAKQPIYSRISTSQLRQVLMAIFENAAESMPLGGTIDCSTGYSDIQGIPAGSLIGGKRCYVEVEDHGVGMDEAIKRRIFEPFFTTKRSKKYTGLSLSAAFNIIKHHKGFISVDSSPGLGTKVRIYLPRYSELERPKSDISSSTDVIAKGIKILVVDDEQSVRQLGSDILTEQGFTVVTADDGRKALEKLRENPDVSLVLLDMVMPVMSGREACIEIKKLPVPPKVLICTGFSELSDLESILGVYAEGLVQKPYTTADLVKSVNEVLKNRPLESV